MIVLCCLGFSHIVSAQSIRITNGEWPPYMSENLKYYGVTSRIVTEAFALEGIKVEYGFFPWKRSFILAQEGKWDGSAVWSKTKEREMDFYFTLPVIHDTTVFFHRKDYPFDWADYEDLKGLKIGATLEYNYGEQFHDALKKGKITVELVSSDKTNFKKLMGKRIPIFVCNIEVGYSLINQMYDKETASLITSHPRPVKQDTLSLILTKKNPKNRQLVEVFNKGIEKLKQTGKMDQYVEESRRGEYKQ